MTQPESEQVQAAATGAAAAVAAVQDEQAEQERAEQMEASTVVATGAAEEAAERAEAAADAAEAASGVAGEASQEAATATATATEAAEAAYSVQGDLATFRTELQDREERLIERMREVFSETRTTDAEPKEVVVTHEPGNTESGTDQTAESRGNTGGSGGTENQRIRRHRFGR